MKKFRHLPLAVAFGLATATALATEPTAPSRIDSSLYDRYAQVDAPAQPRVPSEEIQEYRALPPEEAAMEASEEEGPNRYLETEFLTKRGIKTYGWIDVGVGANNWGSPFNGTITFGDRNWQVMMNQLYLVNERVLDTEDGGWDVGGRVDLLYGTDYIWTTAAGLDAFNYNAVNGYFVPQWNSSKYYGLAMPQLYAEVGRGDVSAKFGHFYTPMGYEVVPAVGNFFYTINNTFQYGEPFTHTGMLAQWKQNDQITWFGGVVNGWDNWNSGTSLALPVTQYYNNNANFLGGATMKSSDESQSLSIFGMSGNMMNGYTFPPNPNTAINANRSYLSTVYVNQLSEKLTYVFQNDNGWQYGLIDPTTGASLVPTVNGQQAGLAQWYGLVNYLFYEFNEKLIGGLRFEYWRDNNGYRMLTQGRNFNYQYWQPGGWGGQTGFQGNFWEVTWGLNWLPNKNWRIRPELRYDWYTPDNPGGPLPYGGRGGPGDQYGQLYGGCDAIFQF